MRINQLHIQNFRKFADLTIDLHPRFTLLIGGNGSGKTTILDALAVSLGVWLNWLPTVVTRVFPHRNIRGSDLRLLVPRNQSQSTQEGPSSVTVRGQINGSRVIAWGQTYGISLRREEQEAGDLIHQLLESGTEFNFPVLAFYGVTRASLPENSSGTQSLVPAQRWDAYLNCLNARIDYDELRRWFYRETAAAGANGGHKRPGFEVVRRAVLGCVPEADDLWFDVDHADLVCSIGGVAQPLGNLSDGQRMLLAMVADIAIKAVTLNAHLLPANKLGFDDELFVLKKTPGVVLIDELDLHLHPSWQRSMTADLNRTFPAIQFICTSHSPQIIGEVPPGQIRIIDGDTVYSPDRSLGVDSSRILEEIMDTKSRTKEVDGLLSKLARQIDDDDFEGARSTIHEATKTLGENDPEIIRARTLIAFVENDG